jgi:hypothetical protein
MAAREKQLLIVDRTEWHFGKLVINLLVLAVQCGEIAVPINLTAMTLKSGEYLIRIGNGNLKRFIQEYKKRWQIEELFACLTSRGFNFEDHHLTNPTKIAKIMAILTLACLWAFQTGQWLHQIKPLRQKKRYHAR